MRVKSYLDAVAQRFPAAYKHCCACRGPASTPCYWLQDLWSPVSCRSIYLNVVLAARVNSG